MSLICRPKPIKGESLSSYIHRIAKVNNVYVHEIWRLISKEGTHYPQASMSSYIDIYPYNLIDMKLLEELLVNYNSLDSLTFIPVYEKLGIYRNLIPSCRSLSGLIYPYRKYCPHCLNLTKSYKLIWQINELKYCPEHNKELLIKCYNCNKSIPILPNVSELGICPYCNFNLAEGKSMCYVPSDKDYRILNDWLYLITSTEPVLNPLGRLLNQQSLALKTIYLCNGLSLSNSELTTIKSLQQIAKESKATQTSVHLKSILHFSRISNVSLDKFFINEIPEEFTDKFYTKPNRLINQYYCIAPWCKNYLVPSKLERTATCTKHLLNGNTLNYYLYCPSCGLEYAVDHKSKTLLERGYFINLAWKGVKNQLVKSETLATLAQSLNTSEDKIKISIIFLAANSLIDTDININIPKYHEQSIKNKIIELIQLGYLSKEIQSILGLSYNAFLYYWFLPEIKIIYLNRHAPGMTKKLDKNDIMNNLDLALKFLIENKQKIIIKNISRIMGKAPETLRNNGLLSKIKDYKQQQNLRIQENNRTLYLYSSENYIKQRNLLGLHVYSDELYLHLNKKRNVIVRTLPDVTKKIAELLKKQSI